MDRVEEWVIEDENGRGRGMEEEMGKEGRKIDADLKIENEERLPLTIWKD